MIIALAGKKQSGKNTLANFLAGHVLKSNNIIDKFNINEKGELVVNCTYVDDDEGKIKHDMGVLDLTQQTPEFFDFAAGRIWPYIKLYAFADPLKNFLFNIMGVPYASIYGTNEEKNQPTDFRWSNMPSFIKGKTGRMTGRELMQYFGTEICRQMNPNVWVGAILRQIEIEQPTLAVITDCRFPNEFERVQNAGGKIVYLKRSVCTDNHKSENALDLEAGYDLVINNQEMTVEESCAEFLDWCVKEGVTNYIHKPSTAKIK
jgi:hypothetical protein